MIKVFIVDDHHMVIEGIRVLLQSDNSGIELCGFAASAENCLAHLSQQLPDVILMDINLPGTNGIELCKIVREKYPSVFVIGLSTFNQLSYIKKMMDNGASGYLLKNAGRSELISAITNVMHGQAFMSPEAARVMHQHETSNTPVLTRREKEVLELIAEGCTNSEMAGKLFISINTVDTHRKNLLMKLNARNTAALVRTAIDQNLL